MKLAAGGMNRILSSKFFLLTIAMIGLLSQSALAAEVNEVVWKHPGYDITVYRTGKIRIDFVLNKRGTSRTVIESGFGNYPSDRFRERVPSPKALEKLFQLVDSSDWAAVKSSYRAPEGTFEYYGHEVVTTLLLKSGGSIVREVELGGSRKRGWPEFVRRVVDEIVSIATEDGSQLPRGPFLD